MRKKWYGVDQIISNFGGSLIILIDDGQCFTIDGPFANGIEEMPGLDHLLSCLHHCPSNLEAAWVVDACSVSAQGVV